MLRIVAIAVLLVVPRAWVHGDDLKTAQGKVLGEWKGALSDKDERDTDPNRKNHYRKQFKVELKANVVYAVEASAQDFSAEVSLEEPGAAGPLRSYYSGKSIRFEYLPRKDDHYVVTLTSSREKSGGPFHLRVSELPPLEALIVRANEAFGGGLGLTPLSKEERTRQQAQVAKDVHAYFASIGKKLTKQDVSHGLHFAKRMDGAYAKDWFDALAKQCREAQDAEVRESAVFVSGVARRLGLQRHTMSLRGVLPDGKQLDWNSYRGKAVYVFFWTATHKDVLKDLAELRNLRANYDERLQIIAINVDKDRTAFDELSKKIPPTWTSLRDADLGKDAMATYYGLETAPFGITVFPNGVVDSANVHPQSVRSRIRDMPHLNARAWRSSGETKVLREEQGKLGQPDEFSAGFASAYLKVEMKAGTCLRIEAESKEFIPNISHRDSWNLDPRRKISFESEDGTKCRVTLLAPKDEMHVFEVMNSVPNQIGVFTFRVSEVTPTERMRLRVAQEFAAEKPDAASIRKEVFDYLRGRGKEADRYDSLIAQDVGNIHGDVAEAKEYFRQLLELTRKLDSAAFRDEAEWYEGILRRLELPGKKFDFEKLVADGKQFDPKEYQGKVVVLDFWRADDQGWWTDLDEKRGAYSSLKSKGLEMIGVNLDWRQETLDDHLKTNPMPWRNIFDRANEKNRIQTHYGVSHTPTFFVVGKDGNVVSVNYSQLHAIDSAQRALGIEPKAKKK